MILDRPIALIGFMGAGKTTVAAKLSHHLRCGFVDIDEEAQKTSGMTVSEIFSRQGESAFRALESKLLRTVLDYREPTIISCGGGIVLDPHNRKLLESRAFCIFLEVSPAQVADRITDRSTRPLISDAGDSSIIEQLIEQRTRRYQELADIIIDTDNRTPDEVCDAILTAIESEDHGVFHP
jgi:shikimate kinase